MGTRTKPIVKMPHGKYKGRKIQSVPSANLEWLLDNDHDLDDRLRFHIEQELQSRDTKITKVHIE